MGGNGLPLSEAKAKRLRAVSTSEGIIAAIAIDQRKSLRILIAADAGVPLEQITDHQLTEFKSAVTRVLTRRSSAVLIDPEYGEPAFSQRASGCGLLMTYEMDGYENPRPHRMLALMPKLSVSRLREMGADGVKILLSYTPFEDESANDEKHALIERIGSECKALDMPFFLEPLGYDPGGADPRSAQYSRQKPEIVIRTMEEFSKDRYRVDVLKVEFPVNAAFVEGCEMCQGRSVYSREQALAYYRQADEVSGRPYIYLSAGVSCPHFLESLQLAQQAGARFSGVLCGRATWQPGVRVYAQQGLPALERWLENDGLRNLEAINACLSAATPWYEWQDGSGCRKPAVL